MAPGSESGKGRWARATTICAISTTRGDPPLAVGPFPFMPGQAAITSNRRARGTPGSISVDNRTTEFGRRAMDACAYQYGVRLDFIRRDRSVDRFQESHSAPQL